MSNDFSFYPGLAKDDGGADNQTLGSLGISTRKWKTAYIDTINSKHIETLCFETYQDTNSDPDVPYNHLLPLSKSGQNYYIGKQEAPWTRLYSKYIKSLCFEATSGTDYYTIRPAEQTHYKSGSDYKPVSDRTTKYHLGTGSYQWDSIVINSSTASISYNGSESGNTSDERKKNSITELPDEYSILFDKLNAVIYKYNDGSSNRYHTGFIAQDVEKALVESGLTTQDFAAIMHKQGIDEEGNEIDCYYLRYGEFVALNTSEIQKLKKRVIELENQLAKLTNKETVEPS